MKVPIFLIMSLLKRLVLSFFDYINSLRFKKIITEEDKIPELENNNFSDLDWMALVWWFVNHTLYRQQLHNNPNIFLLQYKDLVTKPKEFYYNFSSFSGLCFRNAHVYIDSLNLGKGKNPDFRIGHNH